jgi:5-methylcytosine-specific restriction endonuclease McrA
MKRGRPREAELQTCQVCSESFYKPPSHLTMWPARACSRSCAAVLRRRDRIERRCQHCQKSFAARADQVAKGFGLYCSKRCNGLAQFDRLEMGCRWCGSTISVTPHSYRTKQKHFCGRDCRVAWLKRFGTQKGVNAFTPEQRAMWLEDRCRRCGVTGGLELDHILPRFAGGKATRDNAQTLCRRCNREKFWKEDLIRYEAIARKAVAG